MNLTTLIKGLFKSAAKKIEKAANTKIVTLTAVTGDPSEITTLPPFNRKDPKGVAAMVVLAIILVVEAIGTFKRQSAKKAAANA